MIIKLISLISLAGVLAAHASYAASPQCDAVFSVQDTDNKVTNGAHDTIAHDLYTGRVVSMTPFKENDNRNLLFLVKIEAYSPFTGKVRYREAFFKPSVWGDSGGFARAGMEYIAYAFNRLLDMDYVPPTAYRRNLSLDGKGQHFTQGAIIFKVPNYTPLADLEGEQYNFGVDDYHDAVISDHRVLAVLLQNGDGHRCNLGQGNHWVDGKVRPAFIDWGASLRPYTYATMTHYDAYGNSKPVTRIRAQTYAALKDLKKSEIDAWVGSFIGQQEANDILSRRDGIVAYFDRLIEETGYDRVIIP